ncbi:molybdenum cofactor guanylyltransferase [Allokutzneria albata]|uniref:Molybdopterin-guanine dinucleotide biosynthesis protein A n=1 Tax=Allokutzneria albata TaxID=211114 RepID=A0A1G9V9V2_ALLAB|nr:molybdenum cofactor guanylyltransferase [Allokutzneria albata]SDM68949.1 Molybdopterin-guanine dinucleotide biosynthesis protein A [Allokutzneria albata]
MELIVLAGGEGSRLGGQDKAALVLGGRTLLDRVLDAVDPGARVIVVGPRRETARPVVWTREDPPGGGPVAGLAAGLARVSADVVAVLAVDQPGITAATLTRLRAALTEDVDGVVLVDAEGRPQWMVGVWRTGALRRCLPGSPSGSSLRRVLGALTVRRLPAENAEADDIDTPEDLGRWRERAE